MSEQRKMRAELKQGLHQFTMSLYQSYLQSLSHEQATELIVQCLEEEHGYYSQKPLSKPEVTLPPFTLETHIQQVEQLAKKEDSPDKQFEFYNDLETLLSAKEILEKYSPRK